jgi:hypothetical protein
MLRTLFKMPALPLLFLFPLLAALSVMLLASVVPAADGGWYLMLPPVERGKSVFDPPKVERSAPLTRWRQEKAFDSAEACDRWRDIQANLYDGMANKAWDKTPYLGTGNKDYAHVSGHLYLGYIAEAWRYAEALCIASNDPRLAPLR